MTLKHISSAYHNSVIKRNLDLIFSLVLIIIFFPLLLIISITVKSTSPGPVFFIQKRSGKNGKEFNMIKFRTMKVGSEKLQSKYRKLNEADGPVFKIYNDPRLTPIGKVLFQTGLDELPQLINVLKNEMSLVGPRPLPVYEADKLTKTQKIREIVKPGITSSWIVQGSHELKFNQWMKLDMDYVKNANIFTDIKIIFLTLLLICKFSFKTLFYVKRQS